MARLRALARPGPIVGAGLTFLLYAAITVPLGHILRTTAMTASGLDTLNDGVFFFIGGTLSWIMLRRDAHWISCRMRTSLELVSIAFGLGSYSLGLLQPSTNADLSQAVWSVILGILGVAMNRFWHKRVQPDSGALGFRWNLLANWVGAFVLIPAGLLAYFTGHASFNYWATWIALFITVGFCIRPAVQLTRILLHKKGQHDTVVVGT